MTLTTHAVTGAAVALLFPSHPAIGFFAAFVSHFILDAIPHWDYHILSGSIDPSVGGKLKLNKNLIADGVRIGSDALSGVVLALVLFASTVNVPLIFAGILGGMLPDFFQFLYVRLPFEPLSSLQRFHVWIHSSKKILNPVTGIVFQIIFMSIVAFWAKFFL